MKTKIDKNKCVEDRKKQRENVNQVIKYALETLDLSPQYFSKIAGQGQGPDVDNITLEDRITPEGKFNFDRVLGVELVHVLKLLYLDNSFLAEGYDRAKHLNMVCHAIERKEFAYKKGKIVKAYFRFFKAVQWRDEAKLYGLKLLWKIRIRRWLGLHNS